MTNHLCVLSIDSLYVLNQSTDKSNNIMNYYFLIIQLIHMRNDQLKY